MQLYDQLRLREQWASKGKLILTKDAANMTCNGHR